MKKFTHFLKVFGLSLLAGLAGGIIHIALSYFFDFPKMGYIFIGVAVAIFYAYFVKINEKSWWDIPFEILGDCITVAITQFFDLMLFGATKMVGEDGKSLIQKTFLIYKNQYYTVTGSEGSIVSNESVYQELILLVIFTIFFGAIATFILRKVEKSKTRNKTKKTAKKSSKK